MGAPFPVMEAYTGFMSDLPRHQLPPGVCWDLLNFIPEIDGSTRRRYGFQTLDTRAFSAIHVGSTNSGYGVYYCPFNAAHEVLALDSAGHAFSYQEPTLSGAYMSQLPSPVKARGTWHKDRMVLVANGMQTYFYEGQTGGMVAGTGTPQASYSTLWGDYTVQGNNSPSNQQRIWFSAAGDPTTYDLTNSWLDVPGAVKGLESIRGALFIWTDHEMWRITGTTPPQANVVGDLVLKHFADLGLVDERSISIWGGWMIWANAEGVWMTDGASAPRSLTVQGGINTFWRTIMKGYSIGATDYIVAGSVYRDYYIVSVSSVNNNIHYTLVCDLTTHRWFKFTLPGDGSMFARGLSGHEDTYIVSVQNGYVASLASVWESATYLDWNGSYYASLETPFFRGYQHWHRKWIPSDATSVWQRAYLNYDGRQGGGSSAFHLGYTTSPESGAAYTTIGQVPATTAPSRYRMAINPNGGAVPSRGLAFKIWEDASAFTYGLWLNDFELEWYTREGSR